MLENKILKILVNIYYEIYLLQVSTINILNKTNLKSSIFIIILIILKISISYFMNKLDKYILNKNIINGEKYDRNYRK